MNQTIEELLGATKEVSTDLLVELAHGNRTAADYQDAATLLDNLPIVLRAICDYVLSDDAKVLDTAYALASLVDAIEHRPKPALGARH